MKAMRFYTRLRSGFLCLALLTLATALAAEEPLRFSPGTYPMVDDELFEQLDDAATFQMHRPQAEEVVLVTGEPWEGNTSAYYTVFQDGDLYRMYYRGSHYNTETQKAAHEEVTCYAESRDGIHWTKPQLGLFEFNESKENNIIWKGVGTHCFAPFLDENPAASDEARYKALSRGRPQKAAGLYAFHSADGIHWELTQEEPVITQGAFDSQNLAFWDPNRQKYVAYYRHFRNGVRDIMVCESDDFLTWSEPQFLSYADDRSEHLYTNAIRPYPNATQLWMGFPTRYTPSNAQVEPILMTSRDGETFHRWSDALIPHTAPEDRSGNRSNYIVHGLLTLPEQPDRWSVYGTEAYYTGPDSRVRRFSIRKDGFVSLSAGNDPATALTKPLLIDGERLFANYRCSSNGKLTMTVCDTQGEPLREDGQLVQIELHEDAVDKELRWEGRALGELSGEIIRFRMELQDSEIFALRVE